MAKEGAVLAFHREEHVLVKNFPKGYPRYWGQHQELGTLQRMGKLTPYLSLRCTYFTNCKSPGGITELSRF